MDVRRNEISPAELVSEVGALLTGLGVLSVMLAPLAVPALLLALVLVLPLLVLALPALAVWLLVKGISRLLGRAASDEVTDPDRDGRGRLAVGVRVSRRESMRPALRRDA